MTLYFKIVSNSEKFLNLLSDITDMFTGSYHHSSKNIEKMRCEMLDISDIPAPHHDKILLRKDINIFLKDTKKAEKELKKRSS
ncbi:conserved hypothetical protein [Tenacibaculum maritimum]|uniref:Uncharacterized protein n=1 Tax=Tenacibaculum maritimum NCIMB 2154 TaxID=1349785 RepID=A0A2H1E6R1_9FLAO|nr:hypothetical protein B9C57_01430 [Tenacibaculum maritimum]SFZ80448.1 conserved protein of unknown function [Tenacibaculum maritimum NCIMB 2154]CAA0154758.1 conserved hypothetical protein [Tenacibaculum maritimum]CAA0156775.1 conserved hypothetical protein [Tenacibaculum maritimum]CAA0157483.1 conserved hypothetical protein [Tenacibaculum maritimum]